MSFYKNVKGMMIFQQNFVSISTKTQYVDGDEVWLKGKQNGVWNF